MNMKFNGQTLITIVAVLIIMAIAFTDKFDVVLILPVLGAFCVAHGIFTFIKAPSKEGNKQSVLMRFILQIVLGGFIMMLGIVELADITLSQNFWNGVLIVIVIIALLWLFTRGRDTFKNH